MQNRLKTFQERLTDAIKESKLSHPQICERSEGKITFQHLWIWQNGKTYPRIPSLCLLADILGKSIDYLLGRKNEK